MDWNVFGSSTDVTKAFATDTGNGGVTLEVTEIKVRLMVQLVIRD